MEQLRQKAISRLVKVIAVITLLTIAGPAKAAPAGLSLTLSPTSLRYELDAGKSAGGSLTIINDGTEAYDFSVSATPYNVSGEDYRQSFALKPDQTDVSKWVKVSAIPYHLEPGKHVEVPYDIKVPNSVGPGGYYAVIFAETSIPPQSASGVTSRKRVGSVLYLRVNGPADERGRLESFDANFWQTEPPLRTSLRLSNQGNVHYQADVSVYVSDLFGNVKARLITSHIILPQTIRRIDQAWPGAPAFGLFKVYGKVNLLGRTESLPTHYVLVMSSLFFVIAVVFITLIGITSLALLLKRRHPRNKKAQPNTTSQPPNPPRRRI